tara:strand:+ start:7367 stop:8866 length:1500 start_codon:yes stop_codon:yes gene_type:complete
MKKLNITSVFLLLLFSSLYFLTLKVAFFNYENFEFTSDIFHNFSAIRNLKNGHGPYEGPIQQFIFGRHTYLIFYLIYPLLYLFNDPKILIIINISSVFISSLFIYIISLEMLKKDINRYLISSIITILFIFYPIVVKGYFIDPYGFGPDIIAAPLFLYLFYSVIKKNLTLVLINFFLILLVKEEFILILPALFVFVLIIQYLSELDGIKWNLRNLAPIFIVYLITSILLIIILFYYKKLNTDIYAEYTYLPFQLPAFEMNLISKIIFVCLKLVAPVTPLFLLFIFYKGMDKFTITVWLLLSFSVLLRVIENYFIYQGNANGSAWSNFILAPIIFILIIVSVKKILESNLAKKKFILIFGFSSIFILSITNNILSKQNTFKYYLKFFKNDNQNILVKELKIINKKIEYNNNQIEFMILPSYLMYPFMQMSTLTIRSLEILPKYAEIKNKELMIKESKYILLNKKTLKIKDELKKPSQVIIDLTKTYKKKIYETKNFILYK